MSDQAIAFTVWASVSFAVAVAMTVIGMYEDHEFQPGGECWDGTGQNPWHIGVPFAMLWPLLVGVAAVVIPMMLIASGIKKLCDRCIMRAKP